MATQKIVLKSVDQHMDDYVATYQPIYPLLLGQGKSQQYAREVGKLNFKRLETVGDIRAKHITPKDTEIFQLAAAESSKTFKKYFLANQFTVSHLQDQEGVQAVINQVLDEHQKQADELLLNGDGTASNNVVNNGLFFSGDANYVTENSVEIASSGRLLDFHGKVLTTATKANLLEGRKLLMFYGSNILPYYNSLYENAARPWKSVLGEVLGPDYSIMEMPASITPSSNHGWMIVNLDQVKTHYCALPSLEDQGSNDEKKYWWFNFVMSSFMVECLQLNSIIRQPATLGA